MRKHELSASGAPLSISGRLINLRNDKKLTLAKVAEYFQVNKSTVSRWESEDFWYEFDAPNKRLVLLKLVELYQSDYDWVVFGEEGKPDSAKNVLIIDDDATSLSIMTIMTKSFLPSYYEIHNFSKPNKALVWAKQNSSALVFCDYRMPFMKGDEFITKLRTIPSYKTTPIIAVTQVREEGVEDTMLSAGANCVLQKPLLENEIQQALTYL